MAEQLSGVAIIVCIALGVLTFVILFIFAKRQIVRFTLKSRRGPHVPIAHDAPKALKQEIERRLEVIREISYEPKLIKEDDDERVRLLTTTNHFYRQMAVDEFASFEKEVGPNLQNKAYCSIKDKHVFLLQLLQAGLLPTISPQVVNQCADLYMMARHEPGEFDKSKFAEYKKALSQVQSKVTKYPTVG